MKTRMIAFGVAWMIATAAVGQVADWPPEKQKESEFTERKLETFQHGI